MKRMLIISFVEWHGAVQRPQHMARGFAALGWDVTYVNPRYLHRRAPGGDGDMATAGVRVIQPACLPGERHSQLVGNVDNWLIRRSLSGMGEWDAVIFNDPRRAGVAKSLPAKVRIFDAMDDLRALMPSEEAAGEAENSAIQAADKIWTGTGIMAERLHGRHKFVQFMANGVDVDLFGNPAPEKVGARRAELETFFQSNGETAGPLAGFFGALNERLDPELVGALLDEGCRVVLIGPSTTQCPKLPKHPRLALPGWRAYEDLPAWLACFDLAIIPYRTDGPNQFLYPVKALEYLAGGKPVLSSPLPDVVKYLKDYVLTGESPEGWRRVARDWNALRDQAVERAKAGKEHARKRDWAAMVREMADQIGVSQTTAEEAR